MINKKQAEMYCAQPIELIENYDKAVTDTTQVCDCHNVWETMLGYSKEELIEMNEYYGIPACNLIFLTHSEHMRIHNSGENNPFYRKHHTNETKVKISEIHKGKTLSEDTRRKMSFVRKGKKATNEARKNMSIAQKGRFISEETRNKIGEANKNGKLSKIVLQLTKTGELVREWPSTNEVERILVFFSTHISACCLGKIKHYKGYIWKYKE